MKKPTNGQGIVRRKPLFNTSLRKDHHLPPDDAKDMVKTWFKTPPAALSNMFYTFYKENEIYHTLRAVTYELPAAGLQDLIAKYNKRKATNLATLKVYLGCEDNYNPSEISEDTPAFLPFIQLNFSGDNPTKDFEDCYRPLFRKLSTTPIGSRALHIPSNDESDLSKPTTIKVVPNSPHIQASDISNNPSHISPESAHIFIDEWCHANNFEIEGFFTGLVQGQVTRVNSFSYLKEDLEQIATLVKENPKRSLFLHLAVIKPNTQSPFSFHIVLEVAEYTESNMMPLGSDGGSTFFEFGYPCPPYCQGLGGG